MSSPSTERIETLTQLRLQRDEARAVWTEAYTTLNEELRKEPDYLRWLTGSSGLYPPDWLEEVDPERYRNCRMHTGLSLRFREEQKAVRTATPRAQTMAKMQEMEARLEDGEWEQSEEPKDTAKAKDSTANVMTVEDILD